MANSVSRRGVIIGSAAAGAAACTTANGGTPSQGGSQTDDINVAMSENNVEDLFLLVQAGGLFLTYAIGEANAGQKDNRSIVKLLELKPYCCSQSKREYIKELLKTLRRVVNDKGWDYLDGCVRC